MTGKATPQFVGRAWSVSVTALYKIVVYHQLSGSSSIIWNGDDRKSDTSICPKLMKCFSDSFIYDCWISSFVRIFTEYLKWRCQEKQHLNLSRGHEVFQLQLYIRLLYIIIYQDLHRIFEIEMTGEAIPQFVEKAWSVSKTALLTIVVYHQLSGASWSFRKIDDRKSDTSTCRKGVKCFSNSFIYDCWISPFVRIFTEYLKWRSQEKQHLILSRGHEVFH